MQYFTSMLTVWCATLIASSIGFLDPIPREEWLSNQELPEYLLSQMDSFVRESPKKEILMQDGPVARFDHQNGDAKASFTWCAVEDAGLVENTSTSNVAYVLHDETTRHFVYGLLLPPGHIQVRIERMIKDAGFMLVLCLTALIASSIAFVERRWLSKTDLSQPHNAGIASLIERTRGLEIQHPGLTKAGRYGYTHRGAEAAFEWSADEQIAGLVTNTGNSKIAFALSDKSSGGCFFVSYLDPGAQAVAEFPMDLPYGNVFLHIAPRK
ncbi:hypothetical protein PSHT_03944 [Puccinia striiformis]|uniref:Uncharacterized protein n=2 Tax=Puccinia striiformis TaxID=27350 RepID=A0A2S4WEG3_9BASI|nr:hypothetical protein PSTT_10362 [Puccinia striiformis]POW20107.1 hypothetical protein PSHT_03944 [Puccinia striiformis]